MMNILAAGLEISEEELRNLRGRCVQRLERQEVKYLWIGCKVSAGNWK